MARRRRRHPGFGREGARRKCPAVGKREKDPCSGRLCQKRSNCGDVGFTG
jgi:hypothetical protein